MNSETLRACRALFFALVCTGLFSLVAAGAGAQASASAEDAAYKELIEQALSEFKHKNWPEARVLFMRAHEQNPNARTSRGMGIVSFEMRDYLNAVIYLNAALEDTRQPLTDVQRKECEGLLTRARTYVGVYTLKLDPAEARVQLDGGDPMHDEEGHMLVPFGEHTLTARAQGRQDYTLKLTVQGGERGEISLALLPERGPEPARAEQQPAEAVTAKEVAKNEAAQARHAEPQGFVGHGLKYSWIPFGLSAAAGGAAVAFWMLGGKKLDQLDKDCATRASGDNPCTKQNTSTSKVETYQTMTNVAIGVSAAALVTTAVLMGLEWPRERQLALNVGPTSLSLRGAF
jgi:tetratricopeptide (TPR) repeat protein